MVAPTVLVTTAWVTSPAVTSAALALSAGSTAPVVVVGPARGPLRAEYDLGPVRVIEAPVDFVLRDAAEARAATRRAKGLPGLRPVSPTQDRAMRHRAASRQRSSDSAARGPELWVTSMRARRTMGRVGARASDRAWRTLYAVEEHLPVALSWRGALPEIDDIELALGPVVDSLEPAVIRALDTAALPVAVLARDRARASGGSARAVFDQGAAGVLDPTDRPPRAAAALHRVRAAFAERCDDTVTEPPDQAPAPVQQVPRRPGPKTRLMVGFGPTNSAGQAWAWSQALHREFPEIATEVVSLVNGKYDYPADRTVTPKTFAYDPTWGLNLREHAREHWSHALIEAGRPIFGGLSGPDARADIAVLRAAGISVGLVFHGSEVRDPRRHAATHPFSPFTDPADPYTARLQATVDHNLRLVDEFDGPVFVSTPDQLDYVSRATWLPVVVELSQWPTRIVDVPEVPLVVHAPSNPRLKGTTEIESALQPFLDAGRIRYQRVTGLQPAQAAEVVRRADIVIDQALLGLYGVLTIEAIASGAVVLGHVGEALRARVPAPVPVLEITPPTLADVLESVLADLPTLLAQAPERRGFVERFHDGCYSAKVLRGFVDVPSSMTGKHDPEGP